MRWTNEKTWAVLLVILGVYFLLATFNLVSWSLAGKLWPIILIVVGLNGLLRKK